jgi:ribonuclease inhibitor
MRKFVLDGNTVESRTALHDALARGLAFPDWYGGNWDALFDCLTDLGETDLRVTGREALEAALGPDADRFFRVLRDAAAENPRLHLTL